MTAHLALWQFLMRAVFEYDNVVQLQAERIGEIVDRLHERLGETEVVEGVLMLCEEDLMGDEALTDVEADIRRDRVTEYIVGVQQHVLEQFGLGGDDGTLVPSMQSGDVACRMGCLPAGSCRLCRTATSDATSSFCHCAFV